MQKMIMLCAIGIIAMLVVGGASAGSDCTQDKQWLPYGMIPVGPPILQEEVAVSVCSSKLNNTLYACYNVDGTQGGYMGVTTYASAKQDLADPSTPMAIDTRCGSAFVDFICGTDPALSRTLKCPT